MNPKYSNKESFIELFEDTLTKEGLEIRNIKPPVSKWEEEENKELWG